MASRRWFLLLGFWLLVGCSTSEAPEQQVSKLTIGVVAYGEGTQSVDRYHRFTDYLGDQSKTLVELEPVYNEVKAIEQIHQKKWSLVFAPPGLAAIAISTGQYLPLFPLQGVNNQSSVLVVLKNSPLQKLGEVSGKRIALGQPGSATGYYVPLYELYGTAPAEIRIAPTPKTVLAWIAKQEVEVGALSKDEFEHLHSEFAPVQFRILHASRRIPAGSVLISPTVERNQQRVIQQVMSSVLPAIAQEAGYVPNAPVPDYKDLITFIQKVKPIEARIREKPAPLYQ
ncbi:MAG: phosphate/phosphite/phosphonate ABC transporter substrate-binding protein [Scytolyngbya sp. HA4215-MV1]|jgi:phosphonate transport system substrate-binding protein|nr:phosphate/phosphite/phosphonate ABC transporter substrate-binding protein [Scytolyngbya sp. HA4215-MV1]